MRRSSQTPGNVSTSAVHPLPTQPSSFWTRKEDQAVVRNRRGNVLTRGLILKTDHFAGTRPAHLSIHLQGAPNFRKANVDLGVYGVAQPSITGLKTILSVLGCQPEGSTDGEKLSAGDTLHLVQLSPSPAPSPNPLNSPFKGLSTSSAGDDGGVASGLSVRDKCVWVCTREEPVIYICGRPFVLRDADTPTMTLGMSDRASNLEGIESRLKDDILNEASKHNNLLLVHEEDRGGNVIPTWICVSSDAVMTVKEVYRAIIKAGWKVEYHRVPISETQAIENNYLDAYAQIIKRVDPRTTSIVANCGAGFNRTTFAMVAALLIRRKQLLLLDRPDPFQEASFVRSTLLTGASSANYPVPTTAVAKSMEAVTQQQAQSRALLRLIKTLGEAFSREASQSVTELLLMDPVLTDSLRAAGTGDFGIIRQLSGLLDEGLESKALVDTAVDACSQVTNLREAILIERVQYAAQSGRLDPEGKTSRSHLQKALRALERYYFLVAFASYVNASKTAVFDHRFVVWLKARGEIWNSILRIRSQTMQLYLFDPISDLSSLSKALTGQSITISSLQDRPAQGEIGDEFAEHIIRNRAGIVLRPMTLLKCDIWRRFAELNAGLEVRGTVNFRCIEGTEIYATGQPTDEGINNVIMNVTERGGRSVSQVTWLNLREEPLVYINGKPYCLRPSGMSLRNSKAFSGISWTRLQLLEDRLKGDILAELTNGDNRVLLHTETEDGAVVPVWEEVEAQDVQTVSEVMGGKARDLASSGIKLDYRRIPITAEKMPDSSDMTDLLSVVLQAKADNSPIILNDQLGRGRSTLTAIIVLLVSQWIDDSDATVDASPSGTGAAAKAEDRATLHYHIINSVLRVLPKGLEVKRRVDRAIDACSQILNLRDSIEEARLAAEDLDDKDARDAKLSGGLQNLRRYFELMIFQAYLMSTVPSIPVSSTFERFVTRQPVFKTLAKDFENEPLTTITPLQSGVKEGLASESEEQEVISNRNGSILSPFTMLKSDFFPGILKKSLPVHIDGMPNMRGVPMQLLASASLSSSINLESFSAREVWGTGMPTLTGLRLGLQKMGAAPDGPSRVVWTSLREEPVLYVKGRPHVLRLADQPLTNVEATGITTEVVEQMERALKADVINEARARENRVLLHDEIDLAAGRYELVPVWEHVADEDVLTPREVYETVVREGYKVDYARLAVTDEQAPRATVFSMLENRIHLALRTGSIPVFNCQMGRGRTSVSMIIASLVTTISIGAEDLLSGSLVASITIDANGGDIADEWDEQYLIKGEYRSILQLVGVLTHGQLAKKLADRAIDLMEAVQNLRKAVYDAKLRLNTAEAGTSKWRSLHRVYANYLQRYGYLIAFADYLLEKSQHFSSDSTSDGADIDASTVGSEVLDSQTPSDSQVLSGFPTFVKWLQLRPEIGRILDNVQDLQ
ncbi:hypothetical protein K437DRAFT_272412 [Tilletiaria anomala UBC 951]|uniref:Paladin n=1 Tax=Tilletiaria anomala (strain ATCC 24038 / CBS 436.72 / UBC 951) TaxID=1037660 RepID=A0A066WPJ8_TILAU|nr:uncharacterized protein K437DRAFT_272412 [Tilletiaria anomala UBC 951]KDN52550.1 hypothetical protein K437DRAFT_272412 [Tilletiaria anomala UBC 951]